MPSENNTSFSEPQGRSVEQAETEFDNFSRTQDEAFNKHLKPLRDAAISAAVSGDMGKMKEMGGLISDIPGLVKADKEEASHADVSKDPSPTPSGYDRSRESSPVRTGGNQSGHGNRFQRTPSPTAQSRERSPAGSVSPQDSRPPSPAGSDASGFY